MILKCDSLDCQPRGSDNAISDPPFSAPMKTELLKSVNLEKKRRSGVALLFCVCLTLFVFTAAAAQVRDNKHITAIQLGGAAEGSRVTVVSDSPLIDYEAFRRGDRFYVKIPLADLSAAAGPVGRTASGAVIPTAAVYTYSKSKGLFAGVSLEGAVIGTQRNSNFRYYGQPVRADEILSGLTPAPAGAAVLRRALGR